jgi:multiple sugar transport system permease protein
MFILPVVNHRGEFLTGVKVMKRKSSLNKNQSIAGYIFILPFIFGFLAFTLFPMLMSLVLSFTSYDILSPPKFVGWDNFVHMFTKDSTFRLSLSVTLKYAFISVPLRLIMALLVAMLLKRTTKATKVYRAVYYLPSIMGSSVAVAILWRNMFSIDGVINGILGKIGLPSDTAWLSSENTALWTIIILSIWQFGSSMLVFLSGLKQIDVNMYEAASIDGANKVQTFFRITIPLLTPVIFFNLVMQLINGFMAFTQSYIITQGRPMDTTLFYTVYMHRQSFVFYEMGYGSALAWVMLLITGLMTLILFGTSKFWVFNQADN